MMQAMRFPLLATAQLAAGLCLATGVAYVTVSPTELAIPLLVALAAVGACVLAAVGVWQHRAPASAVSVRARWLAIVALLFTGASVVGALGARAVHVARREPTGLPIALHVASAAVGLILFAFALHRVRRCRQQLPKAGAGVGSRMDHRRETWFLMLSVIALLAEAIATLTFGPAGFILFLVGTALIVAAAGVRVLSHGTMTARGRLGFGFTLAALVVPVTALGRTALGPF